MNFAEKAASLREEGLDPFDLFRSEVLGDLPFTLDDVRNHVTVHNGWLPPDHMLMLCNAIENLQTLLTAVVEELV